MMKFYFKILMVGIICFITVRLEAQVADFDPYAIEPEYFEGEKIKHGYVFGDHQGNTYKINVSAYSKGLYIKKDNKWLQHGVAYTFSRGQVTSKTTYYYGKKHGVYQAYHSNGKLKFQYSFKDGIQEGKAFQYLDNGNLYEECEYKNGAKEGIQVNYHSNGSKQFVGHYINNKRHGEYLQYNEQGKLVARTQYHMGNQVGKTQWY